MKPGSQLSDADSEARDVALVALLDSLSEQLRRGESPDIDEVLRDHPDFADELRELWGTIVVTQEMAKTPPPGLRERDPGDTGHGREEAPAATLPDRIGDFEVLRELGRGGMGVVYEARQVSLGRRVALKILLRRELATSSETARFRAEAEAAAGLDHPNIVPVFEVGTHDELPFFTMRFVDGTTLGRRLTESPLEPRAAVRLLVPICRAIHYAHENGVLHRDLKPSNILIDQEGMPHVSDFGLAKRIEADVNLTQSGAIIGTPGYMAPEQAAGNRGEISPVSDVYSLGAVLYHMVTGRPPFQAATPVDTVLAVLEQDPVPPRLLNAAIDRDLEMIILKCLQKPPELRYVSASKLADDLENYLNGDSISVRNISLPLLVNRLFRATHHDAIMENWGILWMWHSVVVLCLCVGTNIVHWRGVHSGSPDDLARQPHLYILIWTLGFGTWAATFWSLRRRGGPITAVERQIAHIWAAPIVASTGLFVVEIIIGLDVLTLSPILGLLGGMCFLAKAGIISGKFYFQAAALFLTAAVMAWLPDFGLTIFGVVTAVSFFIPGLMYSRRRARRTT